MNYNFSLPWPPTVNHFHMPVKMGKYVRNIKSPKVKEYQKKVKFILQEKGLSLLKINRPVTISLVMHPKTNAKYDCSNFLKSYEDALVQGGFLEDDHWIEYGEIRKGEKVKGGRLDIYVKIN